jgi:hypothetical protein
MNFYYSDFVSFSIIAGIWIHTSLIFFYLSGHTCILLLWLDLCHPRQKILKVMSVMLKQQIYIFNIRKNCHDFVEIRTEVSYINMKCWAMYCVLSHIWYVVLYRLSPDHPPPLTIFPKNANYYMIYAYWLNNLWLLIVNF